MLKCVYTHSAGSNLITSMNTFIKITLNFFKPCLSIHPSIHPSIHQMLFKPRVHILGDRKNLLTLSYNFDQQLLTRRLCVLFIFASFIWPVKEEIEAHTVWINGDYHELFVPLTVSGRPSLKRVINAVSYTLSPA